MVTLGLRRIRVEHDHLFGTIWDVEYVGCGQKTLPVTLTQAIVDGDVHKRLPMLRSAPQCQRGLPDAGGPNAPDMACAGQFVSLTVWTASETSDCAQRGRSVITIDGERDNNERHWRRLMMAHEHGEPLIQARRPTL
jgi:hypothetical protein